jgi:hypothetical protein
MTGLFLRFRDFKDVYNAHTRSLVDANTGEVEKNFNAICINNALGCLDWEVSNWFPEESQLLQDFLEKVMEERKQRQLPPSNKHQNLTEIKPPMLSNPKGAAPHVMVGSANSKEGLRMELTTDSWSKLQQAMQNPLELITHPRGIVKYEKVPIHDDTPPPVHSSSTHPNHSRASQGSSSSSSTHGHMQTFLSGLKSQRKG